MDVASMRRLGAEAPGTRLHPQLSRQILRDTETIPLDRPRNRRADWKVCQIEKGKAMRTTSLLIGLLVSVFAVADDKDALDRLAKNLKSKDAKVRLKAIESISSMGEKADSLAKNLCEIIASDRNAKVAKAALSAVESVRPDLYKPLSDYVLDFDVEVRNKALESLAGMGDKGAPLLPILYANTKRISDEKNKSSFLKVTFDERVKLLSAIKRIAPDDPVYWKYQRSFASSKKNSIGYAHKHDAIDEMVAWAGDNQNRRKEVISLLKAAMTDTHFTIKCCGHLGRYGPAAKEVIPLLKMAKMSSIKDIREAASNALLLIDN